LETNWKGRGRRGWGEGGVIESVKYLDKISIYFEILPKLSKLRDISYVIAMLRLNSNRI